MTRGSNKSGGFSLIEVMCAILIMGVALTGLTQGVTAALSASKENELQTAAVAIAAGRIEMLRADGLIIAGEDQSEDETGKALYSWRQTIEETSIDGLFEVTVIVENARAEKKIYELKTLLFDAPPTSLSEDDDEDASSRNNRGARRRK